jgi:hypothetical protein
MCRLKGKALQSAEAKANEMDAQKDEDKLASRDKPAVRDDEDLPQMRVRLLHVRCTELSQDSSNRLFQMG